MFKPFRSHNIGSVEFLVVCLAFAQVLKGVPSARRIYESTLVGQAKYQYLSLQSNLKHGSREVRVYQPCFRLDCRERY